MRRSLHISIVSIAGALTMAGCQSPRPGPHPSMAQHAESVPPQAGPPALEPTAEGHESGVAAATDPSAARMQDLCGALLYYYASNRHLPVKLDELRPYADIGVTLAFTSPITGEPYVYVPNGLHGSGIHDTLLLYDSHANPHGDHWGIVMVPPEPHKAVLMYAIPLSDELLKAYQAK